MSTEQSDFFSRPQIEGQPPLNLVASAGALAPAQANSDAGAGDDERGGETPATARAGVITVARSSFAAAVLACRNRPGGNGNDNGSGPDFAGQEDFGSKWLHALPPATRVLECGCGSGELGALYKQRFPHAFWHGLERDRERLALASTRLDAVTGLDLELEDLGPQQAGEGYDLLVLGDLLEKLRDPLVVLHRLRRLCTAEAILVCWFSNSAQARVVEQLLAGDLEYEDGAWPAPGQRLLTPRSACKLLMSGGWLPWLSDYSVRVPENLPLTQALAAAAATMGMSARAATDNLLVHRLVLSARPSPWAPLPPDPPASAAAGQSRFLAAPAGMKISVLVPVNDERQLRQNLLRSPGLAELDAELILCRGAGSAAQAFESGLEQASADWIVFCHQDVWFAPGFGSALTALLAPIEAAQTASVLLGLAGIGSTAQQQLFVAGFVVDRLSRFDYPPAGHAVSIDELAIIVSRNTVHRPDAALGWHLWGTDLCLRAERRDPSRPARIVRLPVFHNSHFDGQLPPAFEASEAVLLDKYPDLDIIPSLCKCLCRI